MFGASPMAMKHRRKLTSIQHREVEGEIPEICQDRPQNDSLEGSSSNYDVSRHSSVLIADYHPSVVSRADLPCSSQLADCIIILLWCPTPSTELS